MGEETNGSSEKNKSRYSPRANFNNCSGGNPPVFTNTSSNEEFSQEAQSWYTQGYPQGQIPQGQYPYQPYYAQQYPKPPEPYRKKVNIGARIFLFVLLGLSVVSIVGYGFFTVDNVRKNAAKYSSDDSYVRGDYDDDYSDYYDDDYGYYDEDGNYVEYNQVEDLPDIDVVPNEEGISIISKSGLEELSAENIYNKVSVSTVTVLATLSGSLDDEDNYNISTGTGIIATADGYIITNSHVILNSKLSSVRIITYDEQEYDAVVVGYDRTTDLAVLKTNDHSFTPAEFGDAEELGIGEWVIAIGNPGGVRFSSSLTRGVISGLNRTVSDYSDNGMTYIQTDAAINPGNSGGPLVNMYGQVVGINSSKIVASGYEGMGFAIPVSNAQSIINGLLSNGYVEGRVRLGVKGSDVTYEQLVRYNLPQYGFMIDEIDADSAFSGTEAQAGDVIIAIDGVEVYDLDEISNLLLLYNPGDEVEITLYRYSTTGGEGREFTVTVSLLEDKGETQR